LFEKRKKEDIVYVVNKKERVEGHIKQIEKVAIKDANLMYIYLDIVIRMQNISVN